ncbi:1-(5-phosphoribosyl)-5-[(5-phosphoribosylamino)methylideneamino]imidazole-4-carboxamide isomerase [uncultured Holdemanella sp.]|uniref:1-(5-phosphoribosyl)-5-[(5- phosphoribosylamino)methylideneamino]imidazole-4- carboxamide isomerase n=1 Tax=uncultured Holdemanella sp. TaxID=1763549 RepID=UPI0025FDB6AD|nr:1-(5-phosphoribosyl)-5-[(5-phosphoribosylamino)methylideneamino]imidazole-4-carboxamide isomerase [uncultured Holdemanella sp.]
MIVIPAIDILDGKPVRLYQGDYGQSTCVADDVLACAKNFEAANAPYLHVVDLNGAKEGSRVNEALICEIVKLCTIPVEVGGGIRTMSAIDSYIENGVSRVILGTSAIQDISLLKDAIHKYGSKIAVGLDCKDGYVCTSGWLEKSKEYYLDFAKRMEKIGVQTLICTDISKDGTLQGPNFEMLKQLKNHVSCNLIASGGVRDLSHIQKCKDLNLYGVIAGKAIYEKTLDLKEAIHIC